jgi:MFS family permease
VNGILIALLEVSMVSWLRRFRRLRVAALGLFLAGLGFATTGLVPYWTCFLASLAVWTMGEVLVVPQQMSFLADWAPPAARGRYMGLYSAAWSLGYAINPILLIPLHA